MLESTHPTEVLSPPPAPPELVEPESGKLHSHNMADLAALVIEQAMDDLLGVRHATYRLTEVRCMPTHKLMHKNHPVTGRPLTPMKVLMSKSDKKKYYDNWKAARARRREAESAAGWFFNDAPVYKRGDKLTFEECCACFDPTWDVQAVREAMKLRLAEKGYTIE